MNAFIYFVVQTQGRKPKVSKRALNKTKTLYSEKCDKKCRILSFRVVVALNLSAFYPLSF